LGAPSARPLAGLSSLDLPLLGNQNLPTNGIAAFTLNLTATRFPSSGYLTVYPTGTARPTSSNLNFHPGATVAGLTIGTVGRGSVTIYNGSPGPVEVIGDLEGVFTA
jgi:hypothetical protein